MSITVTCRECGNTSTETSGDLTRLAAEQLCFTCDFWLGYVARRDEANVVRLGGRHYILGDENASPTMRGSYGRRHLIRFSDGRTAETGNLWHQGTIPDHFRDRLPDNAVAMKEAAAATLPDRPKAA